MGKKELKELSNRVRVSLRAGKWTNEAQILNVTDPKGFRNILDALTVDAVSDLVRGYINDSDIAKYLRRKYSVLKPELGMGY